MKIKITMLAAIAATLMSAGAAQAQEKRAVGVDEAVALSRVLKAEISATRKVFWALVEVPLDHNPDAKCADEAEEIRGLINEAAYQHHMIRENYSADMVEQYSQRGMGVLRTASHIMGRCYGLEAIEYLHHQRHVDFSSDNYQTDSLTRRINLRDAEPATEQGEVE